MCHEDLPCAGSIAPKTTTDQPGNNDAELQDCSTAYDTVGCICIDSQGMSFPLIFKAAVMQIKLIAPQSGQDAMPPKGLSLCELLEQIFAKFVQDLLREPISQYSQHYISQASMLLLC